MESLLTGNLRSSSANPLNGVRRKLVLEACDLLMENPQQAKNAFVIKHSLVVDEADISEVLLEDAFKAASVHNSSSLKQFLHHNNNIVCRNVSPEEYIVMTAFRDNRPELYEKALGDYSEMSISGKNLRRILDLYKAENEEDFRLKMNELSAVEKFEIASRSLLVFPRGFDFSDELLKDAGKGRLRDYGGALVEWVRVLNSRGNCSEEVLFWRKFMEECLTEKQREFLLTHPGVLNWNEDQDLYQKMQIFTALLNELSDEPEVLPAAVEGMIPWLKATQAARTLGRIDLYLQRDENIALRYLQNSCLTADLDEFCFSQLSNDEDDLNDLYLFKLFTAVEKHPEILQKVMDEAAGETFGVKFCGLVVKVMWNKKENTRDFAVNLLNLFVDHQSRIEKLSPFKQREIGTFLSVFIEQMGKETGIEFTEAQQAFIEKFVGSRQDQYAQHVERFMKRSGRNSWQYAQNGWELIGKVRENNPELALKILAKMKREVEKNKNDNYESTLFNWKFGEMAKDVDAIPFMLETAVEYNSIKALAQTRNYSNHQMFRNVKNAVRVKLLEEGLDGADLNTWVIVESMRQCAEKFDEKQVFFPFIGLFNNELTRARKDVNMEEILQWLYNSGSDSPFLQCAAHIAEYAWRQRNKSGNYIAEEAKEFFCAIWEDQNLPAVLRAWSFAEFFMAYRKSAGIEDVVPSGMKAVLDAAELNLSNFHNYYLKRTYPVFARSEFGEETAKRYTGLMSSLLKEMGPVRDPDFFFAYAIPSLVHIYYRLDQKEKAVELLNNANYTKQYEYPVIYQLMLTWQTPEFIAGKISEYANSINTDDDYFGISPLTDAEVNMAKKVTDALDDPEEKLFAEAFFSSFNTSSQREREELRKSLAGRFVDGSFKDRELFSACLLLLQSDKELQNTLMPAIREYFSENEADNWFHAPRWMQGRMANRYELYFKNLLENGETELAFEKTKALTSFFSKQRDDWKFCQHINDLTKSYAYKLRERKISPELAVQFDELFFSFSKNVQEYRIRKLFNNQYLQNFYITRYLSGDQEGFQAFKEKYSAAFAKLNTNLHFNGCADTYAALILDDNMDEQALQEALDGFLQFTSDSEFRNMIRRGNGYQRILRKKQYKQNQDKWMLYAAEFYKDNNRKQWSKSILKKLSKNAKDAEIKQRASDLLAGF